MAKYQAQSARDNWHFYDEVVDTFSLSQQSGQWLRTRGIETILVCLDLAAIGVVVWLAMLIRTGILPLIIKNIPQDIPASFAENLWWIVFLWILCLAREGLYNRRIPFWRETKGVVQATLAAFLFTMAMVALAKLGGEVSRTILVIAFTLGLFALPLGRYIGKSLLSKIGLWNEPVLILGAGQTGIMIANSFHNDSYLGYRVIGFLEDDPAKSRRGVIINGTKYPIIGGFQDAPRIIAENQIKNVILAVPGMPGPELVSLSNRLKPFTYSLLVVPDLIGMSVAGGNIDYLSDDRIVAYRTHNNLANPVNVITKNLFDIVVGLIILILTIPIIIVLTLIVKIDSPGPAIYCGKRLGRKGKEFRCFKFRTMCLNNDEILDNHLEQNPAARIEWDKFAKLRCDDPRVTRIGKFLRKTSLDELPQIFNVLKGDMSLVGARPYIYSEKDRMGNNADLILLTKPGMTGLWQVSGRNEIDFAGRIDIETWYIRNWSLWLDITLLFRTVGVILGRKGAY